MSESEIARGRSHVRMGVAIIAASSLGAIAWVAAGALPHGILAGRSVVGAALVAMLFCVELLRGNRAARAVAFAVTFVLVTPALVALGQAVTDGGDRETIALSIMALLVGAGFALASLTDEATAWHRAQVEARRRKRERGRRTLADWRAGEGEP